MNKSKFDIFIYNNIDDELLKEWQEIKNNCKNYIYQDLNFLKDYLDFKKTNIENINIVIIRLKSNKKIFAIFPFEIIPYWGIKILRWIGSEDFDYFFPIFNFEVEIQYNFEDLWNNILSVVQNYDVVFLRKLPNKIDSFYNPIVELNKNVLFDSNIYLINLNFDFNSYVESILKNKNIKEFLRTNKKLFSDHNKVNIKIIDENNPHLMPSDIINKKIDNFKKKNKKITFNKSVIKFFDNFNKNNTRMIVALYIEDKLISASFNFIYKNRLYYLIPVIFDQNYNRYSPGKFLILKLIEWAYSNKINIFDFGIGPEAYKKYWSNSSANLYNYVKYNTKRGYFFYFLFRLVKFFKKL